jgi:hypothetical protein
MRSSMDHENDDWSQELTDVLLFSGRSTIRRINTRAVHISLKVSRVFAYIGSIMGRMPIESGRTEHFFLQIWWIVVFLIALGGLSICSVKLKLSWEVPFSDQSLF